ncbi:MAG: LacI family transcriptional regulator [Treponema sp.]|jgi:LacI family transcriptional regulator|nr:LacI family transcriptional regulator [Treponema sp.]
MGTTIRDVASEAGVSTATVSRVLAKFSGDSLDGGSFLPVAEKTQLRVLDAVSRLDYRINYTARGLKTQSTMMVAVIFPELANDFFMNVAEGIEQELNSRAYTMLMASSLNSIEEEKKRIAMLAERMVDGMIITPTGTRGDHLQALADQGLPLVMVDRIVEGTNLDAVTSDNEGGTFQLTRALLADGFRRIAFVGGEITLSSARERLSGFGRALAEAGIKPDPSLICLGGMEIEDGYEHMRRLLQRPEAPEAMVAVNLLVHLGMERCLLDFNPDGMGKEPVIAGFDESWFTTFLPACRYTAAQDAVGMGRCAGRRIIEKIREKKSGNGSPEGKTGETIIRLPVAINRSDKINTKQNNNLYYGGKTWQ